MANCSNAQEKVIILDCCYSGEMGNNPFFDSDTALMRKGVSILVATLSNKKTYTTSSGSIFTSLLIDALQGGAADIFGKVSIPSIYAYVEQALGFFQERPMLKAHVSKLVSIRDCLPAVELEILHKLPVYFTDQNYLYPLDPTYEPTVEGHNPEHVRILKHLQKLRDARLVAVVGEQHMYYAAVNSQHCCLTPQGKYYWYLVSNNLI